MSDIKLELTGDWAKAHGIVDKTVAELEPLLKQSVHQEAQFLAGEIKKRIRTGPFQPLSPLTIASRKLKGFGGSKPLNVTGELKGAVGVYPATPSLEKFIGILKTARAKAAGTKQAYLANIGAIQEEGRTILIKVTPKMLKFLFGVLFKKAPSAGSFGGTGGGTGIIVVTIPPRPFVGPTFAEHAPKAPERIFARVAKALGYGEK